MIRSKSRAVLGPLVWAQCTIREGVLPFVGRLPAIVLSSAVGLWKLIRRSRTRFRDRPKTVRLHPGFVVHLHPGSLFGIIPDWRSASSRNRVHFPPESHHARPLSRIGNDKRG